MRHTVLYTYIATHCIQVYGIHNPMRHADEILHATRRYLIFVAVWSIIKSKSIAGIVMATVGAGNDNAAAHFIVNAVIQWKELIEMANGEMHSVFAVCPICGAETEMKIDDDQ